MANDPHGYVRQRKDGRWEGQYAFQGRRRSIYASSEVEAHQKLQGILDSIKQGQYERPNEHTVSSWLTDWLETYAKYNLRPSTYIGYQTYVQKHILPAFGTILLKNVSVELLQTYFDDKMSDGRLDRKSGGLSIKTLKSMKCMLNVAFSQAFYNRLICFNPVEGVKLPVPEYKEQKVLTEAEMQALLDEAANSDHLVAKGIIILLSCGLRKGELLGLLWEDVDFEENCIRIRRTLSRLSKFKMTSGTQCFTRLDAYAPAKNKTAIYLGPVKTPKVNRAIFMPGRVRRALLDIMEIQHQYRKSSRKRTFNPLDWCFVMQRDGLMNPRNWKRGSKNFFALQTSGRSTFMPPVIPLQQRLFSGQPTSSRYLKF